MINYESVLTYSDLLSSSHVETQISQDQVTCYKIAIENAGEHDGLTVRNSHKSKRLAIYSRLVHIDICTGYRDSRYSYSPSTLWTERKDPRLDRRPHLQADT